MLRNCRGRALRIVSALSLALALAACAIPLVPADATVLIFGEQHDQPDHQRQVADVVRRLAASGRLGAVVLEMAEQGHSTAGLPADADTGAVRTALAWAGWDWATYEDVILAAVRARVPVLGGNLPRARLRETMLDATHDSLVGPEVRAHLAAAVRAGHCGLLPAEQEPGMVRVQIARDQTMAEVVAQAATRQPGGRQVLLLTGAQHASRDRGVPLHLAQAGRAAGVHVVIFGSEATGLAADERRAARSTPRPDPCEGLRRQLDQRRSVAP